MSARRSSGKPSLSPSSIERLQSRLRLQASDSSRGEAHLVPAKQQVDQQVQLAIKSLQAGRLQDAVGYLDAALRSDPTHALAHNCLGIAYRSLGEPAKAIASYEAAIRCQPNYAEAHNNLGIAYESLEKNDSAIACYHSALRCKPDFAAAHNNLGNVLTKAGRPAEALASFDTALRYQPDFPAAINNRGLALRDQHRHAEAEASFRQAIRLLPKFAEAYINLGNVLRDQGAVDAAVACLREAINCNPKLPAAYTCLGNCYVDLGRAQEAVESFQSALQLAPRSADAWFGLGAAQRSLDQLDAAILSHQQAIQIKPDYAEALNNLGNIFAQQGKLDDAIQTFGQAVRVAPEHLAAHNNLGNLYRLQDRLDEAAASYREVLRRQPPSPAKSLRLSTLCPTVFSHADEMSDYYDRALREWSSLRGAVPYTDLSDLLAAANEPPYNLQFSSNNIRNLKQAYARIFDYRGPTFELPRPSQKKKIGFVVTSHHEIAFLRLIWSALKRMDSDEFALSIVCTSRAVKGFRGSIHDPDVEILGLPEHPQRVIEAILASRFDILYYFEIGTDSLNYFLPFFRLAPVQCTSWGIQVTSGIPNVDYYLSSQLVEPEDATEHYTEQLIRGKTLLSYQTPVELPVAAKSREAFGFSQQQTIYLCAQHLGKFHLDFDPMLAAILREDERGIVVITQDRYGYGARRLAERFERTMPDVASRVVQIPKQALPDYLSLVATADVLLDPPHFGGVNSTYDAIALDQSPVILPSQYHRGRYTLGCYKKIGVPDCIADSPDQYVRIANRLGRDREYRDEMRARIRESKHKLFRDQDSVAEHERIFRDLMARVEQR